MPKEQVVGQAWFKANKDGSRDKGLWEEFHLSNPDKMFLFIASLKLFTQSFAALPAKPKRKRQRAIVHAQSLSAIGGTLVLLAEYLREFLIEVKL